MSWLDDISRNDDVSLTEAASYVVACGVHLSVTDYLDLGRAGRVALVAAHHAARVAELEAKGLDIDAARVHAEVDGGRAAARLMAHAAGAGVARALAQQRSAP